jgi:hypothetical protein
MVERQRELARKASQNDDWQGALNIWEMLRNCFLDSSEIFVGRGDALQALGQLNEAEEFLRARFPGELLGVLGQAEALRELGRFADAEAVLTEASERFPRNEWLIIGLARTAMAAGVWDETLTELERFDAAKAVLDRAVSRFPQDAPALYVGLGNAFIEAGRLDEAEVVSADAVARFPNDPAVKTLRAQIVGEGSRPNQPSAAETTVSRSEVTASELMMNFESLGDNCEFGFVQRFHGAEPLGLLRLSMMPYDLLMSALENRFEGVGDPDNTILEVDELHQEFMISNKRYNMAAHTFTYVTAIDRQKFFEQQCRRLIYLRRKLIADLENCEKILIFRSLEFLSDQQIWALFRRIKPYGPNTLLCVRPQTDDAAGHGRVEQLDDRLWIGYIKIIPSALMQMENIAQTSWLEVCRQVYASWSRKGDDLRLSATTVYVARWPQRRLPIADRARHVPDQAEPATPPAYLERRGIRRGLGGRESLRGAVRPLGALHPPDRGPPE